MNAALKSSLMLTAGRCAAFLPTFFIPVVLARALDPAQFGTYKQVFLVYSTLYLIAQLGMAESLFYFLPRDPRGAGRLAANSVAFLAAAGAGAGLVLAAGASAVSGWFGNPAHVVGLRLAGIFLFLTMAAAPLEIILISRGRHSAAALSYFLSDALRAFCLIAPGLLFRDIAWILAGAIAFGLARLGALIGVLGWEFGGGLRPNPVLLGRQLAYALPFGSAVLVEILQGQLHQYAVSIRYDAATFAVYAVGCLQIPFVEFVAGPACNLMMVEMGEKLGAGDRRGALAAWHETTVRIALIVVPAVAALLIGGRELILLLFSERYAASVPTFLVWSTALLPGVLQTDGVLRAFAQTRFLFLMNLLKLALIAATIGWLLSAFGLPGAALATICALAAGKAAALLRIARLFGVGLREILPWRALGGILSAAAVAGLPALLLKGGVRLPILPMLLAVLACYGAAYAALLGPLRIFARAVRQPVSGALAR